jgi:ribosomal protein S18 acetylase RimI-like enzyme
MASVDRAERIGVPRHSETHPVADPSSQNSVLTLEPLTAGHVPRCEAIARALSEWFGIEEGLAEMRGYLATGPGHVALAGSEVVGFVTLQRHFPETWEITWMAVARTWHRRGVGRCLIDATVARCREEGTRWLLVKTLADSHPSLEYRATRAFYQAMGFDRLSVLPDLWGPDNPCLLMIRPL